MEIIKVFLEWANLSNLGNMASIIGFIVTCFLLWEARKIRDSFIKRARIPEIVSDLENIAKEFFEHLKSFKTERRNVQEKAEKAVGLLEGVIPKMDDGQKKKIEEFILASRGLHGTNFNEDDCWKVYSQLSGLVVYLQQIEKDTKWDS